MTKQSADDQRWGSNTRHDNQQSGRDRILEAAMHCYSEAGVVATTIDDIARQACISRRTVYRYFANKQAVVRAVVELQALVFFAELERAIRRYRRDFPAFLKRAMLYTIERGPNAPAHQLLMGDQSNAVIASHSYIDSEVIRQAWGDVLKEPFIAAKKVGQIGADLDFEQLVAWSQRLMLSYIMFPALRSEVERDIDTYVVGALQQAT